MKKPIITTIDSGNMVRMAIVGDLLEDSVPGLIEGLDEATKIISNAFTASGKKIQVLVDLSKFDGQYAVKAFVHMIEFMNATKAQVSKSAVFGGHGRQKMTAETAIAFARRDEEIKVFDSEAEALAWLA